MRAVAGDRPAGLAGDLPAISASVIGSCLPALGPAGRTRAVHVFDGVLRQLPQLGGALARFLHDLARGLHVAMPLEKVARLPPVRKL